MQVYVMRHGQAVSYSYDDASRALTPMGVQQSKRVGDWFTDNQIQIDYALVSPYLRSQQTFDAVVSRLKYNVHYENIDSLIPSGRTEPTLVTLSELFVQGKKNILIVSHLPLVGYLVNDLCDCDSLPMMTTAAFAWIDVVNDNLENGRLIGLYSL